MDGDQRAQEGRVLSIQSHVVFGYVGQKAAVFPLQCLGFDVDAINSVNFSNHTGYGRFDGSKIEVDELRRILNAMKDNELLNPTKILTGYIHGQSALSAVSEAVRELKLANPGAVYLLDPVLGDLGHLYVSADMVPVYQSMLPLATVITPNWFEVEILTGIPLKDFSSFQRSLRALHHDYYVPNVIISSIPVKKWLLEALPVHIRPPEEGGYLLCLASSISPDTPPSVYASCFPRIPGYFAGVGDLFAALVLGHLDTSVDHANPVRSSLSDAVSMALTKTYAIIQLTHDHARSLPVEYCQETDEEKDEKEPARRTRRMRRRELRLIQGQDIIRGVTPVDVKHMLAWDAFWDT